MAMGTAAGSAICTAGSERINVSIAWPSYTLWRNQRREGMGGIVHRKVVKAKLSKLKNRYGKELDVVECVLQREFYHVSTQ